MGSFRQAGEDGSGMADQHTPKKSMRPRRGRAALATTIVLVMVGAAFMRSQTAGGPAAVRPSGASGRGALEVTPAGGLGAGAIDPDLPSVSVSGAGIGGLVTSSSSSSSSSSEAAALGSRESPEAVAQRLTPGSNGESPFDLSKYQGFCRKMRPPNVPQLTVQRTWLTTKQRNATDVTLVTQLSIDRLYMLEAQCGTWGSIISAAVHVAMVGGKVVSELEKLEGGDVDAAMATVDEAHKRIEGRGRCKLDIVFLTEDTTMELVGLYPVNALRNKALMLAQTEIVLLLDADFLPNRGLTDVIHQPDMYAQLHRVTGFRQGIVLPAFETIDDGDEGKNTALKAVKSREALEELFNRGELRGFHMDHYNRGHRATDHTHWFETNISYRIPYEEGFEPYVLVQRKFVPWYDERFKGYRKNKVVHLMHMFRLGMEFTSTPYGYVVHSPHPIANSWNTTQATGFWYKLKKLYADSREDMANSVFVPATAFNCESKEPEKWSFYRRRLAA